MRCYPRQNWDRYFLGIGLATPGAHLKLPTCTFPAPDHVSAAPAALVGVSNNVLLLASPSASFADNVTVMTPSPSIEIPDTYCVVVEPSPQPQLSAPIAD